MALNSLTGQTLGKYRVLDRLGRGGMAQVYRAYHPQLDRFVALKVLRADLLDDESFLDRFRREAQAVAALRHPHIVQVFDFDVQDDTDDMGITFMVMELLEGDTLKARLNDYRLRDEAMPLGEVVRLLLDILDGLEYAHSEGMIHRDLKPANILLTKRGQAVITDFGIAQIIGGTRHTMTGALMGTLNYMAPEQGLEGSSDIRSDIYSLGIVFYEMLTQHTPFDADTPLAILMKHLNDPLPAPREAAPSTPEPIEAVLLKALSKDADDRFQTAEAMAQSLHAAAVKAEIEVPDGISLPLSFSTPDAPSEAVAVISGTTREKLQDVEFAIDDTQATSRQYILADNQPSPEVKINNTQRQPKYFEPVRSEVSSEELPDLSVGGLYQQLTAPIEVSPLVERVLTTPITPMILVVTNLAMLLLAGITGWWEIYSQGWPAQLFLISLIMCAVIIEEKETWLIVPYGFFVGNGLLLSYYSLTDNWGQWSFLWPLEPMLWLLIVGAGLWLAKQKDRKDAARPMGIRLATFSAAAFVFVILMTGAFSF